MTSVEGITEYRLPNGLKVLLFSDASKPTITVNITYLVGSRHENYGETGMAHLLEHLMFKGAPHNRAITEQFAARGMQFNGTTSLDRTNYYEVFQAGGDNLQWALQMEADRMVHSFIAKKDLDSEMTVVRNEYESGENSPTSVLMKRMQSVAYDWHSYGRATIGNRSDIENVGIANLQAFYRTWYQPDNAVLLVAGKFDPAHTLSFIAQKFGAIPKPARQLPKFWTLEPTQDGERSFSVRRQGDVQIVALGDQIPVITTKSNFNSQKINYIDQFRNNYGTSLSLNIRIPILNANVAKNKLALAKITLQNASYVEETAKIQLKQSIEQAFFNMKAANEKYKTLQQQVRDFQEAFKIAEVRFNEGATNQVEYLIAKNNYDRSNINLISALYDYVFRIKILDYYQGKLSL